MDGHREHYGPGTFDFQCSGNTLQGCCQVEVRSSVIASTISNSKLLFNYPTTTIRPSTEMHPTLGWYHISSWIHSYSFQYHFILLSCLQAYTTCSLLSHFTALIAGLQQAHCTYNRLPSTYVLISRPQLISPFCIHPKSLRDARELCLSFPTTCLTPVCALTSASDAPANPQLIWCRPFQSPISTSTSQPLHWQTLCLVRRQTLIDGSWR